MPEWISVKDKLPADEWERVLVHVKHRYNPDDGYSDITISSYSPIFGWTIERYHDVTHWMLLPEVPKEETK